jgi:hypothetical protein
MQYIQHCESEGLACETTATQGLLQGRLPFQLDELVSLATPLTQMEGPHIITTQNPSEAFLMSLYMQLKSKIYQSSNTILNPSEPWGVELMLTHGDTHQPK